MWSSEHRLLGLGGGRGGRDYAYFEGRPPAEAGDYVSEVMDDPRKIADVAEETEEAIAARLAAELKYWGDDAPAVVRK